MHATEAAPGPEREPVVPTRVSVSTEWINDVTAPCPGSDTDALSPAVQTAYTPNNKPKRRAEAVQVLPRLRVDARFWVYCVKCH